MGYGGPLFDINYMIYSVSLKQERSICRYGLLYMRSVSPLAGPSTVFK